MALEIITNNVPRYIIDAHELTDKERKEFGYLDWDAIDRGDESTGGFVRYKGEIYDLDEFTRPYDYFEPTPLQEWDGIKHDTFFSGILIKYVPNTNFEEVIVGRYYT